MEDSSMKQEFWRGRKAKTLGRELKNLKYKKMKKKIRTYKLSRTLGSKGASYLKRLKVMKMKSNSIVNLFDYYREK